MENRSFRFYSSKSEVGSRKSEVGSRKSEVGSRKSEVGSRKSEVGSRKSEVGSPSSAFVVFSFHWSTVLSASFLIVQNNFFGCGFATLN